MANLTIRVASDDADFAAVRALCWEYRTFLAELSPEDSRVVDAFYPEPVYADLMHRLPQVHAPPKGSVRLALLDNVAMGCGMSFEIAPGVAEIKRLYVAEPARGAGAGRALCEALVDDVRAAGFQTVMLDTTKSLVAAQRLYEKLGFRPRGPFYDVPETAQGVVCFYEKQL